MDCRPFDLVPPEVWDIVFQNLWAEKDYSSLANCYKTGLQVWESLLETDKTEFLFHLIVPNLSGYLSTNQILGLRGICSAWKSSIDNYLDSISSRDKLPPSTAYIRHIREPEEEWFSKGIHPGPTFWLPEQIDQFLTQFSDVPSTQNPIPTGTVKLFKCKNYDRELSVQEISQLYTNFEALLQKFGDHIWKIIYYCEGSVFEANVGILNILIYAPNLKCLAIKRAYSFGIPNPNEAGYGKQLISLQLEIDAIEYIPFFNKSPVLERGLENLRLLSITGDRVDSSLLDRLLPFHLPYLQRLLLDYYHNRGNFTNLKLLTNKVRLSLEELGMPIFLVGFKRAEWAGKCFRGDKLAKFLDELKWSGRPD